MPSNDQDWILGQIEAPKRAALIGEAIRIRLGLLLDWGFTVQVSDAGVSVSLGRLAILTVYCEADPINADTVTTWVAERRSSGEFTSRNIIVDDKGRTREVSLAELESALELLRQFSEELESPEIPTGWVVRGL